MDSDNMNNACKPSAADESAAKLSANLQKLMLVKERISAKAPHLSRACKLISDNQCGLDNSKTFYWDQTEDAMLMSDASTENTCRNAAMDEYYEETMCRVGEFELSILRFRKELLAHLSQLSVTTSQIMADLHDLCDSLKLLWDNLLLILEELQRLGAQSAVDSFKELYNSMKHFCNTAEQQCISLRICCEAQQNLGVQMLNLHSKGDPPQGYITSMSPKAREQLWEKEKRAPEAEKRVSDALHKLSETGGVFTGVKQSLNEAKQKVLAAIPMLSDILPQLSNKMPSTADAFPHLPLELDGFMIALNKLYTELEQASDVLQKLATRV